MLSNQPALIQNGIPGLFSRDGFKMAYLDYHQLILDELNESTSGTELENQDPRDIVVELARNPIAAHAFNVASMAFNNHFFFKGLNTDPNVKSAPSKDFAALINSNFSSMDSLREEFLTTAQAMFGPGFVWLVQVKGQHQALRIMPTYLAGSPLSGAHYRRQSTDMNTENTATAGPLANEAKTAKIRKQALGGVDVVPLLCVNTWEHVWLTDYGIRGKMDYLEKWWEKIDWAVVEGPADIQRSS